MILEISKDYLQKFYNSNLKEAIAEKDGVLWTSERIKKAFNFGNGTEKDLKKYIKTNEKYCIFVKI